MAREMSWFFPRRSSSDPDDVGKKLKWLEAILQDDRAWLDDVEANVTVDAQTKITKKEIKEWANDAEDVIDEWKFEQLRAKVEPPPAPCFGRRYARDPVADLLMDPNFGRRVNDLKPRREKIGEYNRILPLGRAQGSCRHGRNVEPLPSSSLPGEWDVHGRDDDISIMVRFLLQAAMEERLSIVPIMGAAGVGKTTLVQHIYNDEKVSGHFDLKEWVSASRGQQMMQLMKAIAESLTGVRCNYNQLDVVQRLLKRKMDGQRFLLVLDDVWNETIDGDQWEKLCATFSGCARGSVIILTTQDERVADRTRTVPSYLLESLSGDPCWAVIQKNAFGSLCTDDRLSEIGQEIAKECQGSPLIAKALGDRLRHERNVAKWEELFSQRDMWHEIVPELKLSYHRLPAHLKRCFVYCSMFPKGYLFNREELVQLWMAQGFIKVKIERLLEDEGFKYFDELFTRSIFQKSELHTGAFVMPNVLHALAQSISDGECITTENCNLRNLPWNDLQKARHLSLTPSKSELSTDFLSIAVHLRSFLVVPRNEQLKNVAKIDISDETFYSLSHLRALNLRLTDIRALPNAISNLKHLRYLNLSGTKIESVHASVFQLYNLQTLDLSCTDITELPDTIGKLSNLLHLRLNVTKVRKIPYSIGKLSKLRTLQLGFTKIEELPKTIGGLKWLRFMCLNISRVQILPESICEISNLKTLELQGRDDEESNNDVMSNDGDLEEQFSGQNDQIILSQGVSDMADSSINSQKDHIDDRDSSSNDAIMKRNVSENQQPHSYLQKLGTRFFHVERVGMGNPSFLNFTSVVTKNCMKCKTLPQLGRLPLLKELYIDGISVEHVGNEFCGSGDKNGFPKLEKLSFMNMSTWKKWDGVEEGVFPRLNELIIFNCPNLKGVPCLHSPLTKLTVERCAVESIPTTETLEDLELVACDNLVTLPKLPSLSSLRNLTLRYCEKLTSLPPVPLPEIFWIEECEQLKNSLPDEAKNFTLSSTTFARCKPLHCRV